LYAVYTLMRGMAEKANPIIIFEYKDVYHESAPPEGDEQ
jgi:hypothetical protein